MLVNKTKSELLPIHDTAKSFYQKAEVEKIEIKGGYKVYFLKSFDSIVSAVIETKAKDGYKYFYLNSLTQKELLTSQTTLRHIKEFYKQFYEDEKITKTELLKKAMFKSFDFLQVHETEDHIIADIAEYKNYYNCNSPQARAFFRNFEGYRQRKKEDSNGKYLFTKSVYGYSNYYFYYI